MNKEFKTENIEIKIDHLKGSTLKLEVKVSKDLVIDAHKRAIKEINKEIDLPGFRRGKAPEDLIIKQHPHEIDNRWRKLIADLAFIEAQKLINIPPLNQYTNIHFDLKELSYEKGADLFFVYEIEPLVPSVDPKKFIAKDYPTPVISEEKLNETIRQAQFFSANWKSVDRPIKEGDYVLLDLDSLEQEAPTRVFSGVRFEMRPNTIAKWMLDLIIGAKKNDIIEGVSKPDDNLPEEEKKQFPSKKVRIKILEIEEAELPELNDDFAKKLGTNNLAEMKKNIQQMLLNEAIEEQNKQKREEVNNFLLDNYPLDLPVSLISTEIKYRKDKLFQDPRFKKEWDKMTEKDKEELQKHLEKEAKASIALYYISKKIIQDANIEITDKEIKDEINHFLIDKGEPLKKVSEETYAICFSRLLVKKATEYIFASSK